MKKYSLIKEYSQKYLDDIDFDFIIEQIALRQKNQKKFSTLIQNLNFIFPSYIAAEQASSEITARYKSNLINEINHSVDLTGGLGIDSLSFAKKAEHHIYCDSNPTYCEAFRNNCDALNIKNIEIVNQKAEEFLQKSISNKSVFDVIYIDPARRNTNNQKQVFLKDLQPNILSIQHLFATIAKKTIIKLSPMLDISKAVSEIKSISQVYVVSVNNECKELILIADYTNIKLKPIKYFAVNIKKNYNPIEIEEINSIELTNETKNELDFSMPLKYIYEPNSSIMKLGLWNGLCGKYAVSKLHSNSHLFTSNECLEHFPGRAFEIVAVTSFTTKAVKQYLCNENQVNIAVRNFPYTVKDIYKKLKLNEGGNLYLFATTTLDNKLSIIITQKIKK